jgi:hypothetical protein
MLIYNQTESRGRDSQPVSLGVILSPNRGGYDFSHVSAATRTGEHMFFPGDPHLLTRNLRLRSGFAPQPVFATIGPQVTSLSQVISSRYCPSLSGSDDLGP